MRGTVFPLLQTAGFSFKESLYSTMYDALGHRIIGAFGSIYLWCFGVAEDRVCSKRLRGSEKLVCLDNIRQQMIGDLGIDKS